MSYCVTQLHTRFHITSKRIPEADRALRAYIDGVFGDTQRKFHHRDGFERELLEYAHWHVIADPDTGDIDEICFEDDRISDDYEMFCAIAPFVEDGSYIVMIGEVYSVWCWYFQNGECTEHVGSLVFPGIPGIGMLDL